MPTLPTARRTPLAPILSAVQARLALVTGLPAERVALLGRRQGPPHFTGDQDLWVRPGPPSPDGRQSDATGRLALLVRRQLVVAARTRLALDPSDRDDLLLLDPTYGHLAFEEQVLDALHDFHPEAAGSRDTLLWEPMRLLPSASPEDDPAPAGPQWEETRLAFEAAYLAPLTQTASYLP
jgi:hypothetical protein